MPTNYSFAFYVIDPANPPGVNSALNPVTLTVTDTDDSGFIRPGEGDTVGGFTVTDVWVGDTVTVRSGGVTYTITGVTFYRAGAPAVFMPTDGTTLVSARFRSSTFVTDSTEYPVGPVPCFVAGTRIATPAGEVAVETIRPGDLVLTRDHGPQVVRWVGQRRVPGLGHHAPIRFAPGALGNAHALLVSPQHRMVVGGWRAELLFGAEEVLVAATHLAGCDHIHRAPAASVTYVHLMFDRHEIVFAEGCPSESFHPGDAILHSDSELRAELARLFPGLDTPAFTGATVLPVVRGQGARLLLA